MSNDASKGYQFTIHNGTVSAVYEIKNGRTKQEKMDRDETWSVNGKDVIKTEFDDGRLETTVYTDTNGDGIYLKASSSYGPASPLPAYGTPTAPGIYRQDGYTFEVADGTITAVYEIERGVSRQERIDYNESWTIQGSDIVKTELEHGITETSVYSDADGDGVYSKVAKTYSTDNGGTPLVWNEQHYGNDGHDRWKGSNGDDYYYGALGDDQLVGSGGNDDLYGGDGVDSLDGGAGSDDLYGGLGNDLLQGGLGKDTLIGGEGDDIFRFATTAEAGFNIATRDVISDFSAGDTIDLSAIDAIAGNKTNDAFTFVGTSANLSKGNANGALWFENGVLYGSNDKDLAAEFQIELTGISELSADSIIF